MGVHFQVTFSKAPKQTKEINMEDIIAYVGTFILSVGVIATFIAGKKYKIVKDIVKTLNTVLEACKDGKLKKATGKARIPDPKKAKLEVSFFWIFYSDYYILELDTADYQYALVGSSSDDYLWILSRTPQMDDPTYNKLVASAKERGYNTDMLLKVPQKIE